MEKASFTKDNQQQVAGSKRQGNATGGTAIFEDNRTSTVYQRHSRQMMDHSVTKGLTITPQGGERPTRFHQIAAAMGQKYGVDTSSLEATSNSSLPAQLDAEATIQGNSIHFAPGMDTDFNMKHEIAHAVDNAQNGTPKGDQLIDGRLVDNSREKVADSMANSPLSPPGALQTGHYPLHMPATHSSAAVIQRRARVDEEKIEEELIEKDQLDDHDVRHLLHLLSTRQTRLEQREIAQAHEDNVVELRKLIKDEDKDRPTTEQKYDDLILNERLYIESPGTVQLPYRISPSLLFRDEASQVRVKKFNELIDLYQKALNKQSLNKPQPKKVLYRYDKYWATYWGKNPWNGNNPTMKPIIQENNIVKSNQVLSTSLHRGFVLNDAQPVVVKDFKIRPVEEVRMVIVTNKGIPIGGPIDGEKMIHSNAHNELEALKFRQMIANLSPDNEIYYETKYHFPKVQNLRQLDVFWDDYLQMAQNPDYAEPGQAELIIPPETPLVVKKISTHNSMKMQNESEEWTREDVDIVLEDPTPNLDTKEAKEIKSGDTFISHATPLAVPPRLEVVRNRVPDLPRNTGVPPIEKTVTDPEIVAIRERRSRLNKILKMLTIKKSSPSI
jgi:hypothetical protein